MVATRRTSAGIEDGAGSLREVEELEEARLAEIERKLPPVPLATGVAIAWPGRNGTDLRRRARLRERLARAGTVGSFGEPAEVIACEDA